MHGSVNAWVSECMGQNKLAALTEEAPFVGDIALKMRCTEAAGTHTHTHIQKVTKTCTVQLEPPQHIPRFDMLTPQHKTSYSYLLDSRGRQVFNA